MYDLLSSAWRTEDEAQAKEASKSLATKKAVLKAQQSRAEANDYQDEPSFGTVLKNT